MRPVVRPAAFTDIHSQGRCHLTGNGFFALQEFVVLGTPVAQNMILHILEGAEETYGY